MSLRSTLNVAAHAIVRIGTRIMQTDWDDEVKRASIRLMISAADCPRERLMAAGCDPNPGGTQTLNEYIGQA